MKVDNAALEQIAAIHNARQLSTYARGFVELTLLFLAVTLGAIAALGELAGVVFLLRWILGS